MFPEFRWRPPTAGPADLRIVDGQRGQIIRQSFEQVHPRVVRFAQLLFGNDIEIHTELHAVNAVRAAHMVQDLRLLEIVDPKPVVTD
jgi:hypothetical protein